ncbi:MAG: hypothetical protein ACRCY3_14815 [Sphingorhabdus sp.]
MSINENNIAIAKENLKVSLFIDPVNGEELYLACRSIIESAINARIYEGNALFDSVIGIESELFHDKGSGLDSDNFIFKNYYKVFSETKAKIFSEYFQ